MNTQLPSVMHAKDQAKRLRTKMLADGTEVGHARSLELVAHQHGFRDWNTMLAAIESSQKHGWAVGDRVTGTYLSQPFSAHIISVSALTPGWFKLGLQLEEEVDVVTSDSFSNFRKRVRGIVGPKGYSKEVTSDGKPHLQIDLV
ncbi:hypothetical protein SAMN04488030_1116 [Aliiroseovarius halocynthiae]|uniref:Glyoxalase-related protein domain-containing protein n=1 Tax=Aliiroseovarius halocynthiae TaxID=985055 RepID=A0A545SVP8_9RHOB|nr:glyoxalase superfamily protein [Aliiroseovarius halocynthiae]TQV69031.1 hypothetical protein FIL88_05530 [Aliiroseovarius halocynthiae]SMR71782.1 hypothetical protein SAMN04488030_1116 [Aliiroseovarius halocynthiae]